MKKGLLSLLMVSVAWFATAQVAITEIMYNPPETGQDSLEYLEITNISGAVVALDDYLITGVTHTFAGDTLQPGQRHIICRSSSAMLAVYDIEAEQWATGTLSNNGETLTITDLLGNIVDEVTYSPNAPWATEANGLGASLELCTDMADNTDPIFWGASTTFTGEIIAGLNLNGTPGFPNNVSCLSNADVVVSVSDAGFLPADITIYVGETVYWDVTAGTQNINGSWDTFPTNPLPFLSGELLPAPYIYSNLFVLPGVYSYQSDAHPGVLGTVTVIEVPVPTLAITEFMYADPTQQDSMEFIEIYNYGTDSTSLAGIQLTNAVTFTFPDVLLAPSEFVIVAKNGPYIQQFTTSVVYQWDANAGGGPPAGLSNQGETITIVNSAGVTVDEVTYTNGGEWLAPFANMATSFVLCDPLSDNSLAASWTVCADPIALSSNFESFAGPGYLNICSYFVIASNDNGNMNPGEVATFDPTANDYVPGGFGYLTPVTTYDGSLGTFTFEATSITFTSLPETCGIATVDYAVCDVLGNCDTATITIDIACPIYYPETTVAAIVPNNPDGTVIADGTLAQVTGIVYGVNISTNGIRFTLIDETSEGISIFAQNQDLGYIVTEGDEVTVKGTVGQFNGLTTLVMDSIALVSQFNILTTPTAAPILDETTESQFLILPNLVTMLDVTQWTTGAGGFGFEFDVTDGTSTWTVRIDNNVDLYNMPAPTVGATLQIMGLGYQVDNQNPFDAGYTIMPRYASDVLEIIVGTKSTEVVSLQVTPNPFDQILTFRADAPIDQIRITDAIGRIIEDSKNVGTQTTFDTSLWPSGIYFVAVTTSNQNTMRKVIKE